MHPENKNKIPKIACKLMYKFSFLYLLTIYIATLVSKLGNSGCFLFLKKTYLGFFLHTKNIEY